MVFAKTHRVRHDVLHTSQNFSALLIRFFICAFMISNWIFFTKGCKEVGIVFSCICMYSGVSDNHTLCVYLFPRKILPCVFISPVLNIPNGFLDAYEVKVNIDICKYISGKGKSNLSIPVILF